MAQFSTFLKIRCLTILVFLLAFFLNLGFFGDLFRLVSEVLLPNADRRCVHSFCCMLSVMFISL